MFSNLTYEDKQAFFELLDEYFESRPQYSLQAPTARNTAPAAAAASTGGSGRSLPPPAPRQSPSYSSAPSPPPTPAAPASPSVLSSFAAKNQQLAGNLISSGLQHHASTAGNGTKWGGVMANPKVSGTLGKIGAASLAKSGNSPSPPPAPSPAVTKNGAGAGLVSSKSFGHVDTSSGFGAMKTMFKDPQKVPPPAAAPIPSAYSSQPKKSLNVPPPPQRRGAAPAPEPEPEPEEEFEGDYAEAVYDFSSAEAGDLSVKAKVVVQILEKTSADWWKCRNPQTGEEGLVPSAYMKDI